ncbi:probable E3 ubiquitin-protein ligase HECTD2 [Patiria miniata]|uniref:HECT-type E3 ubiquitin transferase n=1 Tax=Patiria miniata TaxID=46514 RepID=A0A913Z3L4_PATMI|nr:probable E3 ubiquitin-protein ligase HECTD2 [Patiria miniata]
MAALRPMAGQICASCQAPISQGLRSQRATCPTCARSFPAAARRSPGAVPLGPSGVSGDIGVFDSQQGTTEGENDRLPSLRTPSADKNDKANKGGRFSGITSFFSALGGGKTKGDKSNEQEMNTKGRPSSEQGLPPINAGQAMVSQSAPSLGGKGVRRGKEAMLQDYTPLTLKQFKECLAKAKESENFKKVQSFYELAFSSFPHINGTFMEAGKDPRSTEDPGLSQAYVETVFANLLEVPEEIQKTTLKAIINSLLKDMKKPRDKNDLRAYLVLMQNPQFGQTSTYVIFAHLLRQVAGLCDQDHHYLVHWFKRLPKDSFRDMVNRLIQFISIRLFPPEPADLPPIGKCSWWIPSVTKVLALLNAANSLTVPNKIVYTCFYNNTLDHVDLMKEYYAWQNPNNYQTFTFCQYPFILSLQAKRTIMQKDSEQQMIMTARRSLVAKVQQRQMPNMNMLFLNLKVRRSHLVSDSLHEVARKKADLKKKLRVQFHNEPGLDMGGLTKEWFLLLLRKIFKEEYGMFTYNDKSRCFWFNPACVDCNQEFNLVGVLMGLAVYNSIILDLHFPACTYRKLLSPAVVPYNNPGAEVGRTAVTQDDLAQVNPELAHGLKELLAYDGNVEDDLCMSFQISLPVYGTVQTIDLKPDGANIPVTNENRKEYVELYLKYLLNESIYGQFAAFYHGFHSVCASNALIMLRPEEVEMLVCGSPNLDLDALEKVTTYDGFTKDDQTIRYFWEVLKAFPVPLQKKLMLFATGSDRIPIGGMGEMTFKIVKVNASTSMLPMSHTCFNQLILPPYKSRRQLKHKVTIAISNAEGFGLE